MKRKLLLLVFALGYLLASAQQKVYTGRVLSESTGEGVPSASISIKNTTKGTITDSTGFFKITAVSGNILIISSSGYTSQQLTLTATTNLNSVLLGSTSQALNEVVVIGYGRVRRRDVTGSVASVSADQLKDAASVSFGDALRGKLSGVQVTSSGGEPGAGLNIRIRGINSISASSEPLYVVDGVPIESNENQLKTGGVGALDQPSVNPLSYIDPANIASIEVLKDASAAAIYGSRGANGVILITTKTGTAGKAVVTLTASSGVSILDKRIDMLNAAEYAQFIHDTKPANLAYTDTAGQLIPLNASATKNWQDLLYQHASIQNYNLSFSNSSDKGRIFMSVGYNNTEGIIIGSGFKRLSLSLNADTKISNKFSVDFRMNAGYTDRNGQLYGSGQGASSGLTQRILVSKPFDPAESRPDPDDVEFFNPLKFAKSSLKNNQNLTLLSNMSLNYRILPNLVLKVMGGGFITNSKNTTFISKSVQNVANTNGYANIGTATTYNWLNENTLTYDKTFGNHKLNALVGFTQQQNNLSSYYVETTNFPVEISGPNAIQDALTAPDYGSEKSVYALRSYLGRVNYTFNQRYLFTASLRSDGSSKFYGRNKYSYFPAFAFAWQIGEEKFFGRQKVFSEMKLRTGYGQIGNQGIPPYSALAQARSVTYFSGSTQSLGLQTVSVANKDLTWETSETINAGLDMAILHSRITLSVDAYLKDTRNLLLLAPIAGSNGFSAIYQNIGSIRNKGLEFQLASNNITGKNFSWRTEVNFNLNRNEVTGLGTQTTIYTGLINSTNFPPPNVIQVGQPLGSLSGYIFDGVYQLSDFEADRVTLKPNVVVFGSPRPGYYKFRDITGPAGKPDGIVNSYDRTVIGNPNPKHFGGIRNVFTYKAVTLNTFLSWQYGNQLLYYSDYFLNGNAYNNATRKYYETLWTPTNPSNTPVVNDATGRIETSTYYIKDASFLRLQNISLLYNLPESWSKRVRLSGASLSFSVDNLVLITNYPGYDPELTSVDQRNIGVDYFSYPRPKTYTVAFNVRF